MKKIIVIALLALASATSFAQDNTWERINIDEKKVQEDPKYLVGSVPMVDGRVVFSTEIATPGKSAKQNYDAVLRYMTDMIKEPNQTEQSRISLADNDKYIVNASVQEFLVFKKTALVYDYTRFIYNLVAECHDGSVKLTLHRIYYLYDEERNPQTLPAEETIDDKNGLKKDQKRLSRVNGKFRRKTIDRKDYLFKKIAEALAK